MRALPLLLLAVLLAAPPLAAQGGPTVEAIRLSDLRFGTLVAGASVEVAHTDAGAAAFELRGHPNRLVSIRFDLPADLQADGSPLRVGFGPGSAAWSRENAIPGRTAFDPLDGVNVTFSSSRRLYVWLGGSVETGPSQPAGTYLGTVVITATMEN